MIFGVFVDARLSSFRDRMRMWGSQSEIEAMVYMLVECEQMHRNDGRAPKHENVSRWVAEAISKARAKAVGSSKLSVSDRNLTDEEFIVSMMQIARDARDELNSW